MQTTQRTISQATLSESNRSHILRHLYRHQVSSRAQIARALDLTPAAITKITARLLDDGAIEETETAGSGRGRRSVGLRLCSERFHVIGIKFARSLLQVGTFDLNGTQLTLTTLPTVSDGTIPQALQGVHEAVNRLIAQDQAIIAIGMAVPGPYLHDIGRTAVVSSMNGWNKVNFRKEFGTSFPLPVFIEQDARAGALAEQLFGQKHDTSSLAYYLLGEGVGLGVVEDGRLISGSLGTATELGHISIDVNGRPCDCGNRGCLEQYCSAVAVHRTMVERRYRPGIASLTHLQACAALFSDAQEGRSEAVRLIAEIGRYVGYGCVVIINAFNPGRIILGDILSKAGPMLLDTVRQVVDSRIIPDIARSTDITLSHLPTDATVSGAAAVAVTQFLDQPSGFLHLYAEHRTAQADRETHTTQRRPEPCASAP